MNSSSKLGLESLYHETNRNISETHARLAELNNHAYPRGEWNINGSGAQTQHVYARQIESSINTVIR